MVIQIVIRNCFNLNKCVFKFLSSETVLSDFNFYSSANSHPYPFYCAPSNAEQLPQRPPFSVTTSHTDTHTHNGLTRGFTIVRRSFAQRQCQRRVHMRHWYSGRGDHSHGHAPAIIREHAGDRLRVCRCDTRRCRRACAPFARQVTTSKGSWLCGSRHK